MSQPPPYSKFDNEALNIEEHGSDDDVPPLNLHHDTPLAPLKSTMDGPNPGSYSPPGAYPPPGSYPSPGHYPPPGTYPGPGAYPPQGAFPPPQQVMPQMAPPPQIAVVSQAPAPVNVVVGGTTMLPPGVCTVCRVGKIKDTASWCTWLWCCLLLPFGLIPGIITFCCCCRHPKCTHCGYTI